MNVTEQTVNERTTLTALKWTGTICVILAALCRGIGMNDMDIALSLAGGAFWATAATQMDDMPLIVVNVVVILAIILGVLFR